MTYQFLVENACAKIREIASFPFPDHGQQGSGWDSS